VEMTDLGPWGLEREGPELRWGGVGLARLGREFGTPLYVVNAGRLRANVAGFREAFRSRDLEPEVYYSVKTNPVPAVLRTLAGLGVGAEVISDFELWLASGAELDGAGVVVNASLKDQELLRRAVERGARLVNVKNLAELRALREAAARAGTAANVGLRLNPGLRKRVFDLTTATGSARCPIGFARGTPEWRAALRIVRESPELRFRGLQFHIGSGIRSARPYREALRNVAPALEETLAAGLRPEVLDIGGGFGAPTVREIGLLEALRLFALNRPPRPAKPFLDGFLGEVAGACRDTVMSFAARHRLPVPSVLVEPGRALTASAQLLLLGVDAVVRGRNGRPSVFCDGGAMSLSQLLISEHHAIVAANRNGAGPAETCDIFGGLPTPLDIVSFRWKMPRPESGDLLAVMDTGAYFTSLGNNFAGVRPAIVMIDDGRAGLVRRRETYEDLVSRDEAPDASPGATRG
jgi:diaminopimelate decarboxylase